MHKWFLTAPQLFQVGDPTHQDTPPCRWYSAFHNTTAIVGAGVLGLPFAMKYLLWPGGVVIMILSWLTSLYTLWQVPHLPFSSPSVRLHRLLMHIVPPAWRVHLLCEGAGGMVVEKASEYVDQHAPETCARRNASMHRPGRG